MNFLKKLGIVFLIAGTVFFAACNPNSGDGGGEQTEVTVPKKYKDPVTEKTAAQIIEMMGAGWNLGNTLDANKGSNTNEGIDTETSWSMPKTTKAMIDVVAAAGFSHIRVPVSWHNHIQNDGTIDPKWLARVKEIVDWVIEDGMFCVINIHHDNYKESSGDFWGFCVGDNTHVTQSINYVENIWQQVATCFKDYDQRLVFETLNEPRIRDGSHGNGDGFWCNTYMGNNQTGTCSTCTAVAERINTLNKKALDKIRGTGGNNEKRLVIVPATAASPDYSFRSDFKLPTDTVSNLLALSVHMYTPNEFAFAPDGSSTSTFTDAHKVTLDHYFNTLDSKFSVPIFIGEFSATNKNNSAERVKWAKYYVNGASAKKMAYCLWDNNVYTGGNDAGERHGHLNRDNLTWYDEDFVKAITGCSDLSGGSSNDSISDSSDDTTDEEDVQDDKTALGLTGISTAETTIYTFTNKSDTGATIEVLQPADGWKTFSVDFAAGKENISMKIKNENTEKVADVRFDLLDSWTAKTPLLKTAKKDGSDLTVTSEGTTKYVRFDIPAGKEVSLEFTMETTAAVFVCYFDSSQASGGAAGGKITISEAYMY